jgi:phosphoribosylformylglycinamidine synthase
MRIAVIVFPGSNCDRDCLHVFNSVLGVQALGVWHRETSLEGFDGVVIPGGFSYGDYLRCGAMAKLSPIMEEVRRLASTGRAVIGICNGFQILLESGLLPGAMLHNQSLKFVCKRVYVRVETSRSSATRGLPRGTILNLPIAHAEGNYTVGEDELKSLEDNDQIVMRYSSSIGEVGDAFNPNGSLGNIAAISNRSGNVVGMMPHPERASELILGGEDGRAIFESFVGWGSGGVR